MNILVIKTIVILNFIFSNIAFAKCDTTSSEKQMAAYEEDYHGRVRKYERKEFLANCNDSFSVQEKEVDPRSNGFISYGYPDKLTEKLLKEETTNIYIHNNGAKRTTKFIFCGKIYEYILTKHDSESNLIYSERKIKKNHEVISSRIEIWKENKLVRTKYDGVLRGIVQGKTPCDIEVVEPAKGKSVYLHLDPEKEPSAITQKDIIDSSEVYDVIEYYWYPHCKYYNEKHKTAEPSNDSVSFDSNDSFYIENDNNFLYKILSYKYYAIIIIGVAVICVVIIRKNRKRKDTDNTNKDNSPNSL